MNTIEHFRVEREELDGFWFGPVIANNDPEELKRIKVRVRGVFEEPVEKEHIEWAKPLLDMEVPELGQEVGVVFLKKDIERPYYFPKTFLDNNQIVRLKTLYEKLIEDEKASVKTGVAVVDQTFDEPETTGVADFKYTKDAKIVPEDVATEDGEDVNQGDPQKGFLIEIDKENGNERIKVHHPAGTFIEIRPDGSVVVHNVADNYEIIDGDKNTVIGGNFLRRIVGNFYSHIVGLFSRKIEGGMTDDITGDVTSSIDGDKLETTTGKWKAQATGDAEIVGDEVVIEGDTSITIQGTTVTITGGTLVVAGTATPPQTTGPFCAIPNCVFSGAPHVSDTVQGT